VTRNYWWPEIIRNIESYDLYQKMKNCTESLAEKIMANKVPKKP